VGRSGGYGGKAGLMQANLNQGVKKNVECAALGPEREQGS